MIDQAERLRNLMANRENMARQQRKRSICVIYPNRQDGADNFVKKFASSLKRINKKTCVAETVNQAKDLKNEHDVVLFSLGDADKEIFDTCEEIIIVSTNDSSDILSAYLMIKAHTKYSKKMQLVLTTTGKENRAEKALKGFVKVIKNHTKKAIKPLGYIIDDDEIYYDVILENFLN